LMAGIRIIRERIDRGELGRVAFMEANFLQRACAGADAPDLALVQGPCPGRAALAARDPPVRRAALSRGGESARSLRWHPSSHPSGRKWTTSR
jgi:hypothetical protein